MKTNKKQLNKRIVLYMALLFLLACGISLFAGCEKDVEKSPTELYQQISPSVCTVESIYSQGTGFVIEVEDDAFYVLTNAHVLASGEFYASTAKLMFIDGTKHDATVLGYNTYHDIAVLRVNWNLGGIQKLEFTTDPQGIMVGQRLYSIGNAVELGLAMSEGIVSAKDTVLQVGSPLKYVPVMQITVPVNAGNSGSPVFDTYGKVVGVATYQISQHNSRPVEGVSFCVGSSIASSVASHIISEYKNGEGGGESTLMDISLSVDSDKKVSIIASALNFTATLQADGLKVTSCSPLALSSGAQLSEGDLIEKIGSFKLENASIEQIFVQLYRYVDKRVYSAVKENSPLSISFISGTEKKEMVVQNKYEKNS